jgi:hypothetical protein
LKARRKPVVLAASIALAACAVPVEPVFAQTSPAVVAPYDGSIPFDCVLQDAGTGTEFPDPGADPFCVEYDKTSQNVTDLGIVDFLSKEPARVAAAVPKCFYFQRDHWTGSVVQGQPPELWHWDGSYFFDRARGIGGVHTANLRVGGRPLDGAPFAPPEYRPYFEPGGGGGVMLRMDGGIDPDCAGHVDTPEERHEVYGDAAGAQRCIPPGGKLRRKRVGRIRLEMRRRHVLARLGPPRRHSRGTDRWCVTGGASLRTTYRGKGRPGVSMIRTTSRAHTERRVGAGTRKAKARRRLDLERRFSRGRTAVFEGRRRHGRRLMVGIHGRRVAWLAIVDPKRFRGRALRRALRAR